MPRLTERAIAPGLYDSLVTVRLAEAIDAARDEYEIEASALAHERAPAILARHLATVAERLLAALGGEYPKEEAVHLLRATRQVMAALDNTASEEHRRPLELPDEPLRLLREVRPAGTAAATAPLIPLSESALLVNEPGEPGLSEQLLRELASADRVDLLCAFINVHGVRLLKPALESFAARGGRLRVLTSTYMGATQRKALDWLTALRAEVRVAYDTPPARTRLHAKAWLFHRDSGFTTAFIGSSNLSHSALVEGVEWNVRLSRADASGILTHFETTFERYWASPTFEPYDPSRDGERLEKALGSYSRDGRFEDQLDAFLDVVPWPHQQEMLDQLNVERRQRGNWRNLLVAATGTGKTVVAALDYRRLRTERGELSLLFVAHQERILRQSRKQFRNVLREGSFGELFVAGDRPAEWRHVFASIQSLTSALVADPTMPERLSRFDMVIIDEMHRIAAPTYDALMQQLTPRILLGLSATPERADGQSTLKHFNGRISAELRLWDALDAALLSPFHYFGVATDVDLRDLTWERGGYRESELEAVYLDADRDQRVRNIIAELRRLVPDVQRMRTLGFCVSVKHALFMATEFNAVGLKAEALIGGTPLDQREAAVQALRRGELQALFTVDLFNEGVDIPEVDTLLLLRPTESATVFLQQLGRGLRLCDGKPCLTVLDFIGQHHRKFRFDRLYRAMTGLSLAGLEYAVANGFTRLPAGCHIRLDREPQEAILSSLKSAIPRTAPALRDELLRLGDVSLREFLAETGTELEDLYSNNRTLTGLRREVGLRSPDAPEGESAIGRSFQRLLDLDDPVLLSWYQQILSAQGPPDFEALTLRQERMLRMMLLSLMQESFVVESGTQAAIENLWGYHELRSELTELCGLLEDRCRRLALPLAIDRLADVPLQVHCSYSKSEFLAGFGLERPSSVRQGVRTFPELKADVCLFTLRKYEEEYSPTTMYHDYVLSPNEVHWESPSVTTERSDTGQRYIHNVEKGAEILLFCREGRKVNGQTARFVFLGPADYVKHEGERPMQIVWRLRTPMPTEMYEQFRAAAG